MGECRSGDSVTLDTKFFGDGLCSLEVVSGDHHDLDASFVAGLYRRFYFVSRRIDDGLESDEDQVRLCLFFTLSVERLHFFIGKSQDSHGLGGEVRIG